MRIEKAMAKKRISIVLMILGILLVAAGLRLIGYNKLDDRRAEQSVHSVRNQLTSSIGDENTTQPDR